MKKKLLLLSFVEGAAVMIAELSGARLLAPVFGTSLYVWASVMGITLFALAAGYFVGAYLSLREQKEKLLSRVLAIAALAILFMPAAASYVLPSLSALPLLVGVVISTFFIVLPPVFCLGASSPLFIAIQSINAWGHCFNFFGRILFTANNGTSVYLLSRWNTSFYLYRNCTKVTRVYVLRTIDASHVFSF